MKMKIKKLIATILLCSMFFSKINAQQPTVQELKDSLPVYMDLLKNNNFYIGYNNGLLSGFQFLYNYVSTSFPHTKDDRHVTTSAILANKFFSINCDAMWNIDGGRQGMFFLIAYHRLLWLYLVTATPNNKNQAVEASALFLNTQFISTIICEFYNNNNNNNTPFVDGANDYFFFL